MMRFAKLTAFIIMAVLLSTAIAAPSVDADTKTYSETKYIYKDVYSGIITFGANCVLNSYDDIVLYEEDEYSKWYAGDASTPVKTVKRDGVITESESKTYGVVSVGSTVTAVGSFSYVNETLKRCDTVAYSFTGIKDTTASVSFDFGDGHSGDTKVLVVKSIVASNVQTKGVDSQYDNPDLEKSIVAKEQFSAGVDSGKVSFKCENTDVYWAFVGYSEEQKVTCSMTVDGAATFTDSNVLSIIMIVIALGLLIGLLYVSNKKLIQ